MTPAFEYCGAKAVGTFADEDGTMANMAADFAVLLTLKQSGSWPFYLNNYLTSLIICLITCLTLVSIFDTN